MDKWKLTSWKMDAYLMRERNFRILHSLCLVCGSENHRKSNCPKSRFKERPINELKNLSLSTSNFVSCTRPKKIFITGNIVDGAENLTFLIDSGTENNFMDESFAAKYMIPLISRTLPLFFNIG
jgi:hypothetical protein